MTKKDNIIEDYSQVYFGWITKQGEVKSCEYAEHAFECPKGDQKGYVHFSIKLPGICGSYDFSWGSKITNQQIKMVYRIATDHGITLDVLPHHAGFVHGSL